MAPSPGYVISGGQELGLSLLICYQLSMIDLQRTVNWVVLTGVNTIGTPDATAYLSRCSPPEKATPSSRLLRVRFKQTHLLCSARPTEAIGHSPIT